MPERLPEKLRERLRIWRTTDADALRDALTVSDAEIRNWLPGVFGDTRDIDAFLHEVRSLFDAGSVYVYAITLDDAPVGQCSLNLEDGDRGVLGYWLRTDRTGRGLATSALEAVTGAALAAGYAELELRCDEGNTRSAAVARRAGYQHIDTVDVGGERTPVQTGREMIWRARPVD